MKIRTLRRRRLARLASIALVAALAATGLTTLAPLAKLSPSSATTPATGGLFTPLQQRVYDSRTTTYAGNTASKLAVGRWYPVQIAGVGSAPTSGIASVQVTLTEVNGDPNGTLKADATGVATPNTSVPALLWASGKESNAATIPVGSDGSFQIYVSASTDIVIDLQGYYSSGATAAGGYVAASNQKILGSSSTTYTKGQSVTLQVAGTDQVPASASAVMLSVLVVPTDTTAGNLQVYPAGAPPLTPWLLNWDTSENSVFTSAVGLNSTGQITVAVASGTARLQVAVQGYFTSITGASNAGAFTPQRARPLDTRGGVALAANETRTFQVAGTAGLPATGTGISAVAANLVIYPGSSTSSKGSVLVAADDDTENFYSQFFYPDTKVSAFAVTTLGADGGITIHNSSSTPIDVLLDVEGWFSGLAAATVSCPSPYLNGSWIKAVPDAAIDCTVAAGSSDAISGQLTTSVDGGETTASALSATSSTTQTVTIPSEPGLHTVVASTGTGHATTDTSYSVLLGDWSTAPLTPDPENGSRASLTPSLYPGLTNDAYSSDVLFKYSVSASSDGTSNPVASSGWIATPFDVPAGTLTAGTSYYWKVLIKGTTGRNATAVTRTSPVWSFSAVGSSTTSSNSVIYTGTDASSLDDIVDSALATSSASTVASQLNALADRAAQGQNVNFATLNGSGTATANALRSEANRVQSGQAQAPQTETDQPLSATPYDEQPNGTTTQTSDYDKRINSTIVGGMAAHDNRSWYHYTTPFAQECPANPFEPCEVVDKYTVRVTIDPNLKSSSDVTTEVHHPVQLKNTLKYISLQMRGYRLKNYNGQLYSYSFGGGSGGKSYGTQKMPVGNATYHVSKRQSLAKADTTFWWHYGAGTGRALSPPNSFHSLPAGCGAEHCSWANF